MDDNEGYGWAVGLFAVSIAGALGRCTLMNTFNLVLISAGFVAAYSMWLSSRLICRVRAVMIGVIFDKALKVPT